MFIRYHKSLARYYENIAIDDSFLEIFSSVYYILNGGICMVGK